MYDLLSCFFSLYWRQLIFENNFIDWKSLDEGKVIGQYKYDEWSNFVSLSGTFIVFNWTEWCSYCLVVLLDFFLSFMFYFMIVWTPKILYDVLQLWTTHQLLLVLPKNTIVWYVLSCFSWSCACVGILVFRHPTTFYSRPVMQYSR